MSFLIKTGLNSRTVWDSETESWKNAVFAVQSWYSKPIINHRKSQQCYFYHEILALVTSTTTSTRWTTIITHISRNNEQYLGVTSQVWFHAVSHSWALRHHIVRLVLHTVVPVWWLRWRVVFYVTTLCWQRCKHCRCFLKFSYLRRIFDSHWIWQQQNWFVNVSRCNCHSNNQWKVFIILCPCLMHVAQYL